MPLNCVPEIAYVLPGASVPETELTVGCHAAWYVPAGVNTCIGTCRSENRICPLGNSSIAPYHDESPAAAGGVGTVVNEVPSHSRNVGGVWYTPGLAIISTLPFVSTAAGPSAMSRPFGKSGPAFQVPVA